MLGIWTSKICYYSFGDPNHYDFRKHSRPGLLQTSSSDYNSSIICIHFDVRVWCFIQTCIMLNYFTWITAFSVFVKNNYRKISNAMHLEVSLLYRSLFRSKSLWVTWLYVSKIWILLVLPKCVWWYMLPSGGIKWHCFVCVCVVVLAEVCVEGGVEWGRLPPPAPQHRLQTGAEQEAHGHQPWTGLQEPGLRGAGAHQRVQVNQPETWPHHNTFLLRGSFQQEWSVFFFSSSFGGQMKEGRNEWMDSTTK